MGVHGLLTQTEKKNGSDLSLEFGLGNTSMGAEFDILRVLFIPFVKVESLVRESLGSIRKLAVTGWFTSPRRKHDRKTARLGNGVGGRALGKGGSLIGGSRHARSR